MDFIEKKIEIFPSRGIFSFSGHEFDFNSIGVVWYRRFGGFSMSRHYKRVERNLNKETSELLKFELLNITDFFVSQIPESVEIIGSKRNGNTNKLIELKKAADAGLNIPYSIVTSERSTIKNLLQKRMTLISKSVYNARAIPYKDNAYTMFTTNITDYDIDNIPEQFFPSLIQQEVIKDYEIRVFYILDRLYCMAILSQDNPQTKTDFRRYDTNKPNRFFPCDIDNITKGKISHFMKSMKLNVGSLDFIKSKDGKLYFLEVNYMGQFAMVDFPCNYGIHRDIADLLIEKDKNGE